MNRTFATGSTRDTAVGKMQTSKYSHPLCDYSFNKYMLSKQNINGVRREGDNWQKGIPPESLFESLCRHIEELKLLTYGYKVYEERNNGVVSTVLENPQGEYIEKGFIETLNAIRFNTEALKLHYLKNENQQQN